ncbi:hypothetical protein VTL71DRAFT_16077 [Oculimacula yallundae]|uniref:Uncharacterized protein n=1 Tax=Oculimacula yallundae TaxID=86028 RepID=A0ABR4CDF9_9HELO
MYKRGEIEHGCSCGFMQDAIFTNAPQRIRSGDNLIHRKASSSREIQMPPLLTATPTIDRCHQTSEKSKRDVAKNYK